MDPPTDDRRALPALVRPMLATPGGLPRRDDGWAFEFKWDGVRAIAYVDGGRIRLLSRNDRDITPSYPELRHVGEALGSRDAVLDGEIVAFDSAGRPSFASLQSRMHVLDENKARRLAQQTPVAYVVFDLLFLDGRPFVDLGYRERRAALEDLALGGPHLAVPPRFEGSGADVLSASRAQGLEGVVAKRLDSPYRPGRRSPEWIKVKHVNTQEVVVVGWAPGKGRREGTIGALLMAVNEEDGLHFVGRVGTGFTEAVLADLAERLLPLERATPPVAGALSGPQVRDARWVEPRLVGEVSYSQWTTDGRLRHPSWRGLRPDKGPQAVRREDVPLAQ
jgi:bifunctional non-homologous end joining protein LigD